MSVTQPDAGAFALNPTPTFSVHAIGEEREPVLMIDNALQHPGALVDYAAQHVLFEPSERYHSRYPGLLGPAPLNYVAALIAALRPKIEEAFGLKDVTPSRAQCNYSMVTLAPDDLMLEQRTPHIDTTDPLQFAILHYLCDESFGGTAFYRHRSTGFETLDDARSEIHRAALKREVAEVPPPAAYIVGDTPLYERIAAFDARYDRVLVYRSCVFHSGLIRPGDPLVADPRRGRLTANIFLNYRQL